MIAEFHVYLKNRSQPVVFELKPLDEKFYTFDDGELIVEEGSRTRAHFLDVTGFTVLEYEPDADEASEASTGPGRYDANADGGPPPATSGFDAGVVQPDAR